MNHRRMSVVLLMGLFAAHRALAGFTLEGQSGTLTLDSRIQAAYARVVSWDDEADTEAGANRFYIQQARLNLHGTQGTRLSYRLTAELGNTSVPLRDACIGVRLSPWFKTTVGQFKVPYSFDRLTSGADLLFAWRPDMADALVPGRDIGVMGDIADTSNRVRFRAGVFNGRGQNVLTDDARGRPLWAARVDWTPFAPMRTRKNPVDRPSALALVLGVDAAYSDDGEVGPHGPIDSIDGRKRLTGADLALTYRGLWLSLEANLAHFTPRDDTEGPYDAFGYLAQIGWYFPRLRVEPAVRYDALDPDSREAGDRQRTLSLGINCYPTTDGNLKLMVDYAHRFAPNAETTGGWEDDELRILLQFVLT